MNELLAVVNGLLLGAIAGHYQPENRRPYLLLVCVIGGVAATMLARLPDPDPAYVFVDVVIVTMSAALGLFSARRLSVGRRG